MARKQRIAWLYTNTHQGNPILVQVLRTLTAAGTEARVYDLCVEAVKERGYSHVAAGKVEFWPENVTSFGVRGATLLARMFFRVLAWRPDLVIASEPDAGYMAWALSSILRIPLVYYPFELYGEEFNRPDSAVTRFSRRAERTLIGRGIDGLITQNDARATIYTQERGARHAPAIIENFKPHWNRPRSDHLKERLGFRPDQRVVLYEGVLQRGRCLETLIRAAASFPADAFLVVLGPDSAYARETLRPLAAAIAPDRVHFLPGVPHDELLDLVSGADVGVIAYEKGTRNNLYCAPGKLSDYVHAGIPILASDLPTLTPIIRQNRIGVTFDNDAPASISVAVASVLGRSRGEWHTQIEAARSTLTWETQEPTVRRTILGLLRQ